ncbi:MAG: hypothetical protein N2035_05450 [Chthoniobacterales bacterium]|nr:hypothetical protein [Chthoniobacterales bacterium]
MKSAYELAIERLNREQPLKPLTPQQKAQLSEIDSIYNAKIAERRVFLEGLIRKSLGTPEEATLRQQLAMEVSRLEAEREEKKNRIREGKNA